MGVGLAIAYNGEVVHSLVAGAARHSDAGTAVPPDDDTVWRIGSVTKVFTVLAALFRADEGGLMLDDPVKSLLPAFTLSESIWVEKKQIFLLKK